MFKSIKLNLRRDLRRDLLICFVAIAGVLVYVIAAHEIAGSAGFPLDDAWIHQTYGRNLAQTGHWEYVPGVSSAGSTSPFYTLLLALGYFLHIPYFFWTYALGAAALALAGLIGARLADRLFPEYPHAGLWAGLAIVMAWHLIWATASGMETVLFSALCLLLIALAWSEIEPGAHAHFGRGAAFGLTGAILIATRPEGVLLVGLLGVSMLIAQNERTSLRSWIGGALLGGLIGLTPYVLLNYSLNGTPLPNTFSAKQAENADLLAQPFLVNLWAMVRPLTAGGQLLLVPGIVWATVQIIRRCSRRESILYLSILLWPILLIVLYALRLPAYYQHGRYVIPVLPPLIVLGVGGTLNLIHAARQDHSPYAAAIRVLVYSLAITTVALFVVFWAWGAAIFGDEVRAINSDMVVAAQWLAQNIPADQTLAVHDIGAVGYFAPRPIFDLAGLITPDIIPIIRNAPKLLEMMQAHGISYLMVLPSQRLTLEDDPRFCELFNANGGMGGMTIYKLAWDGHCH